jgi:glucose-6-phosphate isomerase
MTNELVTMYKIKWMVLYSREGTVIFMPILTEINAWKELQKYCQAHFSHSDSTILEDNQHPSFEHYHLSTQHIAVDFSAQCIDETGLQLLCNLAEECHLPQKIKALMSGEVLNNTENRPALHTALRSSGDKKIWVNNDDIMPDILMALQKMESISNQIRSGEWVGFSGEPITDIVNIGIGGSLFGARFCLSALADFTLDSLHFHFISGIDPVEFKNVVANIRPETTLFIIASKSFTTKETLCNMKKAIAWINQPQHINKHLIAVTANLTKAEELGVNHVIPIWNWIGGRYSSCSSINLITCIAIGFEHFSAMLLGAEEMDQHFLNQTMSQNIPVMLALLGIWNNNFLNMPNLMVLIYSYELRKFIPYLQQLDMESNGKSINKAGQLVNYATAPIVWGGMANQIQHSYFQLLSQGTHRIAADIISVNSMHDDMVNKMCQAHKHVLGRVVNKKNELTHLKSINIPMNHISLIDCTPKSIGAFIALYEHKIFAQSVIWDINPFDQPGVELLKQLMR